MAGRVYWLHDESRRRRRAAFHSKSVDVLGQQKASFVQEFFQQSSLHGARHVVAPDRHPAERVFWLVFFVLAMGGAAALITTNYQRFYANPTVVSVEKDYRQWITTFPAVTACFLNKVNEVEARKFIREHWGAVNDTLANYYTHFIHAVANISVDSLATFEKFVGDPSLEGIDMEELAYRVSYQPKYYMKLFVKKANTTFQPFMTEFGLCYSWGSNITHSLSRYPHVTGMFSQTQCEFLNTACYGRVNLLEGGAWFLVHSPFEVPDAMDKPYKVKKGISISTSFTIHEVRASPQLRTLSISQRGCLFPEETDGTPFPASSYNLCKMQCRRNLALEFCGCVPYFYKAFGTGQVCDATGLVCLAQQRDWYKNQSRHVRRKTMCNCLPQCAQLNYILQDFVIEEWLYPAPELTSFRWNMEYTKTNYTRYIIFTFEDLLVSFGGIAGLFLGSSLLSAVEIGYFFTLRLICRLFKSR